MRNITPIALAFVSLALAACGAPVIDGAEFAGDTDECSATFSCQGADCSGGPFVITCTFNADNDIYDCACTAGGTAGESFSEAGVCEQDADGNFTDFDLADASAHAVDDCKFPVTSSVIEEEGE